MRSQFVCTLVLFGVPALAVLAFAISIVIDNGNMVDPIITGSVW